jgi:hypothetical protein
MGVFGVQNKIQPKLILIHILRCICICDCADHLASVVTEKHRRAYEAVIC